MPECFVIMPLTTSPEVVSRYGGDPEHFRHVLDHLFVPAIERAGFAAKPPIAEGADLIQAEIVRNLENTDLVLCDISALNANVFFEFGIRTALDRPICLIRDEHTRLPFDVRVINCHQYASGLTAWDTPAEIDRLAAHIRTTAERANGHNALWSHFGLTHRGTDAINAAPADDVSAAIQVLSDEVQQLRAETRRRSDLENPFPLSPTGFTALAQRLAAGYGVELNEVGFGDDGITVVTGRSMSNDFRAQLREYGAARGLRVSFIES